MIEISVIIRTLNEQKYLPELLSTIKKQKLNGLNIEVVIVDSGSKDKTLEIAKKFNCRITHIKQSDFTFGRSLNDGCDFAKGEYLVFISGHCIPTSSEWLMNLIQPLIDNKAVYSYGKQVARDTTKFSEKQIFRKFYPDDNKIPQKGYFCNNANAALSKSKVVVRPFNEDLTGLEDMFLAKSLVEDGHKIAYVADAPVYHIHDESWRQVRIRYEREAIALQKIMPNVHFKFFDFVSYTLQSIYLDCTIAIKEKLLFNKVKEIVFFRVMQYWGTYQGNQEIRKISDEMKRKYFYPIR
jgi:rhamnosyltransferase